MKFTQLLQQTLEERRFALRNAVSESVQDFFRRGLPIHIRLCKGRTNNVVDVNVSTDKTPAGGIEFAIYGLDSYQSL